MLTRTSFFAPHTLFSATLLDYVFTIPCRLCQPTFLVKRCSHEHHCSVAPSLQEYSFPIVLWICFVSHPVTPYGVAKSEAFHRFHLNLSHSNWIRVRQLLNPIPIRVYTTSELNYLQYMISIVILPYNIGQMQEKRSGSGMKRSNQLFIACVVLCHFWFLRNHKFLH